AGGVGVAIGDQLLTVDAAELERHPGLAQRGGGRVVVGIRPERLAPSGGGGRSLRGRVTLREALGSDSLAHVAVPGHTALSNSQLVLAHDVDDALAIEELSRDDHATVIARTDPGAGVREGEELELAVRPGSMLFYDAETGAAL